MFSIGGIIAAILGFFEPSATGSVADFFNWFITLFTTTLIGKL